MMLVYWNLKFFQEYKKADIQIIYKSTNYFIEFWKYHSVNVI